MTNLDSIFKSRDITLPTKVRLVKAMVFAVVITFLPRSKCLLISWGVVDGNSVVKNLPAIQGPRELCV